MIEACHGSAFEQRLSQICGDIAEVEERCSAAEGRAQQAESRAHTAEAEVQSMQGRLDQAQSVLAHTVQQLQHAHDRNLQLAEQVNDMQQQLSSCHERFSDVTALAGILKREKIENARLSTSLCTAQLERDSALTDLATAYSDMQSMQAALLDSALLVRYLRAKMLEMKLVEAAQQGPQQPDEHHEPAAFGLQKTKEAVQAAIRDAASLDPPERAKRIKMLRLRWHPDKNGELADFCSEVTKIINTEIDRAQLLT